MAKKRFNWKSRQVVKTVVDNSESKNIVLDLKPEGSYDAANELVLPSKKRKTKIVKEKVNNVRILSKKHRKRLEKVVERKKKKANRSNVLEELQKVQLPKEERVQFSSLASIQTKGLKRIFREANTPEKAKKVRIETDVDEVDVENNEAIILEDVKEKKLEPEAKRDLNVVTVEESSSDDSSDNEEVKEEITKVQEPVKEVQQPIKPEPAVYVDVIRDPEIQKMRLKLPILSEEQQIMETIKNNNIVVISGETGSGKTTQLPQFLYEAGYAIEKQIAVTEPRRIAAISMSERVAKELSLSNKEVSFLIRFQGNVTDETKIKFMTDGVLLKELQTDFLLSKYSVVILDEAHERSLYTDILIGLLSRIVKLREKRNDPLKMIIMSATLRIEDFTKNAKLFKTPPPVINVEARQFPVTIHFNRRTDDDYVNEALKKTVKIHTTLPDGGILVFVTGQQEVNYLVRRLRKKFPFNSKIALGKVKEEREPAEEDGSKKKGKVEKKLILPEINLNDYSLPGDSEIVSDEENSDEERDEEGGAEAVYHGQPLWVLPLYSLLQTQKQNRVFEAVPNGCRLCVVSTNVAETSLTIPGIKYVVDTGKTKTKLYDKVTGVSTYVVCWTSKASADQRAGRAGRTGPGHCYRLYSSAVFNDTFAQFSEPEIRRAPADDIYLRLKTMHIDKILNFPFPTAPDLLQLKMAESRLKTLGLLDQNAKLTPLGKAVSKLPVLPRFGKMLALSHQYDILPYTVCLVAALSVPEVLLEVPVDSTAAATSEKWMASRIKWAGTGNFYLLGDNMVLLKAVGGAEYAHSQNKLEEFCSEHGLRSKAITEIRKLRIQLSNEITANVPEIDLVVDPAMPPPTDLQAKLLRQILLTGLGDQIARKMTIDEVPTGEKKAKYKYAYHANDMEDLVYLHRGSVMKRTLPEFVVYHELYETNKIYMRGVTAIEAEWLPIYVPSLCNLSPPLEQPAPSLTDGNVMCTVTGTFGKQAWTLPPIRMEYPDCQDAYRWFARFFLEGKVVNKLKKFSNSLLSPSTIMCKAWAKLQPRTVSLLKAFVSKGVRRKKDLLDVWRENPKYLLLEYLEWVPQGVHGEVSSLWPPV